MDSALPSEFDVIVIGTGLVESAVSAAASRVDKRVLHIDRKDFYGGAWASFNLESIGQFITKNETKVSESNENEIPVGNALFDFKDVEQIWHIAENEQIENKPEASGDENVKDEGSEKKQRWTKEQVLKESRKFNIDLAPKLQFARGDFVELLISSNIARYSEFRSVTRVMTYLNGHLEIVPCSRSDIFSNDKVGVIEKRMLMKLLTTCVDGSESEFDDYKGKTFKSYLTDRKLSSDLIHYILYAIAMCDDETPCEIGVTATKRFLNSLGRFGKTPLLYSMYGSGEIPQAFCRMSAVFGGVYALGQPLESLKFDSTGKVTGLITSGQTITANYFVTSVDNIPHDYVKNVKPAYISRAVFITDRSILKSEQENLSLVLFPSEDGKQLCYVIEAGSATGTVPKDLYLVYMYTRHITNPKDDLRYFTERLFEPVEAPKPLWSFYYAVPDFEGVELETNCPENVFVCPGPDIDLDYDRSIKKAKEIFARMYPEAEMLPRAPDPEEIIFNYDGDEDVEEEKENIEKSELEDSEKSTSDVKTKAKEE